MEFYSMVTQWHADIEVAINRGVRAKSVSKYKKST